VERNLLVLAAVSLVEVTGMKQKVVKILALRSPSRGGWKAVLEEALCQY
jgi:hypothetical protein